MSQTTEKQARRKSFERSRDVHPVGITGKEAPADIIANDVPRLRGPAGAHRVRADAPLVAGRLRARS